MYLYALIQFLSIIIYLQSYFPIQPKKFQNLNLTQKNVNQSQIIDKFVLIVIDSLRYDFVNAEMMPKSAELMDNTGCLIKLKAETPTVTLPRIKAMTTGNVPQFIDILNNLGKADCLDESLLHRARAQNKSIVFYGDDTWLKIFPNMFTRSEGTVQFFINDFYEVDTNVTKNANNELSKNHWDIMILHYLGLDHIGHVLGPKSSLVKPKLKEMDEIIAKVYDNVKSNQKLVLVTSDHGMRDSGGHGGSTSSEIFVPLLVLGMSCKATEFAQIDLTPNLAVLLGVDIPQTNIGQLQESLLQKLDFFQYLNALKYNTLMLNNKLPICNSDLENATLYHDLFLIDPVNNKNFGKLAQDLYKNCSQIISEKLQVSPSTQNMRGLLISIFISLFILIKIYCKVILNKVWLLSFAENILILFALIFYLIGFNILFANGLLIIIFILIAKNIFYLNINKLFSRKFYLLNVTLVQPILFFTTSFLLEEHQFWYFISTTFILFFILSKKKLDFILLLSVFRIIVNINQIGNKGTDSLDLSDWFLISKNSIYLQMLFIISLIAICLCNYFLTKKYKIINNLIDIIILFFIYAFRFYLNEDVTLGKIIWFLLLIKLFFTIITKNNIILVWILIISLLLKPFNIILIPFCVIASFSLKNNINNYYNVVLSHWWLGTVLFFAQGHDNSLSCVDISSGYIGLETYHPIIVSFQVLCHTFALPVLSHWLLMKDKNSVEIENTFVIFLLLRINVIFIVSVVLFVHKDHPFIWSVFASKIFIEGSHFVHLLTEIFLYKLYTLLNKKIKNYL